DDLPGLRTRTHRLCALPWRLCLVNLLPLLMQHPDNDPHRLNGQNNQHWKFDHNKRAMAAGQKQPGEAEKAKQDEWDESATNIRLHHAKGRGDETGEPKKVISQPSGW